MHFKFIKTLLLRASTYPRNHCIVAQTLIIVTTMVIQILICFSSNHLASWSNSLLLLVLLLNRLDILVLMLYFLMNVSLVILCTASHDLFRDGGCLNKVSLQEKFGPLEGISKGSFSILAIKYVSEFVRELAIRHQNILPLSERENCFIG